MGFVTCNEECEDKIQTYGKHVLTCGLFFKEFVDRFKEGDGLRVLRCWSFVLPLFKSGNRVNYSLEALNLLMQYLYILPPRKAQQLVWSRIVNTKGWIGHNLSCDLFMEHMNHACKTVLDLTRQYKL